MLLGAKKIGEEEIWFPYIEAVEVNGDNSDADIFAGAVLNLYVKENSWRVLISKKDFSRNEVDCISGRYDKIYLLDYREVIDEATKKLGFDSNKVSWRE